MFIKNGYHVQICNWIKKKKYNDAYRICISYGILLLSAIFPIFPGINVIFLFYIRRNTDEFDFDSEQILIWSSFATVIYLKINW